jgi:outer membrane protein
MTNKIKTYIISLLILLVSLTSNAAEKIAVIDFQAAVENSKTGKEFLTKLDDSHQMHHDNMQQKAEIINKEKDALQKKQSVLSPEAFEKERMQFESKVNDFQKQMQLQSNSLEKARLDGNNQLINQIEKIIEKISEKKGFILVIPSSATIYVSKTIDITSDVIDHLNKDVQKIDFKVNF